MTKIGIISDTHIGKNDKIDLEKIHQYFEGVDLILHAGDITQQSVLNELGTISQVIAVKGNADRIDLNTTEIVKINNFKIALNHGIGLSDDFDQLYEFGKSHNASIVVTGHTHRPHFKLKDEMCLVNPGSVNRPIDSNASIAILKIDEEDKLISDVKVNIIEL